MRRLTALLVLLCAAAPASAQDAPVLAGTTTISGDRSGYVEVVLAQDVAPPREGEPSMTMSVSGPGYLRGGRLLPLKPDGNPNPPPQAPWFAEPEGETGGTESSVTSEYSFEAGRYRLYLVTEAGIPTTLTVTLHGLAGEVHLTPTTPIPVDAGPFEAHPSPKGFTVVGRFVTFKSHGGLWYSVGWDYGPEGHGDVEDCRYYPWDKEPPPPNPFAPGCNGQWQFPREPLLFTHSPQYQQSGFLGWGDAGHTFGFGLNGKAQQGKPPPRVYGYAAAVSMDLPPELTPRRGSYPWSEPTPPPAEDEQPPSDATAPPAETAPMGVAMGRAVPATPTAALVRLRCAGETGCAGWASVRPDRSARVRYRIAAGSTRTVRLPLTRAQAQRLRADGRLRATLTQGRGSRVVRRAIALRRAPHTR